MRRSTLRAPWALILGEEAAWPPSSHAGHVTWSKSASAASLLTSRLTKYGSGPLHCTTRLKSSILWLLLTCYLRVQLCQKAGWGSMADGVRSSHSGRVLVQ